METTCTRTNADAEWGIRGELAAALKCWHRIEEVRMTDLEKDAARYRWLRDRMQVRYMEALGTGEKRQGLAMRVGHGFLDSKIHPEHGWTDPRYFNECRQEVDAAIDAAIESYNAAISGAKHPID